MKQAVLENLPPDDLSQLLDAGDEVVLNPKGHSMLPFIREGKDKVKLIRPVDLKEGDIVLAWINGKYILHRIYTLDGDKMTLMGDGNLRGTERGKTSDVIGVVTEIITQDGHSRKPRRAWLWRHTLGLRKYQLKAYRKRNKIFHTS